MSHPPTIASNAKQDCLTDKQFDDVSECWICEKNFHAFRRKHRCKSCGQAVCSSCAKTHKVLPQSHLVTSNEPVRVCDRCVDQQQQQHQQKKKSAEADRIKARQEAEEEAARARETERILRTSQERAIEMQRSQGQQFAHTEMTPESAAEQTLIANERPGPSRERPHSWFEEEARLSQERAHQTTPMMPDFYQQPTSTVPSTSYSQEMTFGAPSSAPSTDVPFDDVAANLFGQSSQSYSELFPLQESFSDSVGGLEMKPAVAPAMEEANMIMEPEECAVCLEPMGLGNAIYTTACNHSFHFSCLKEIQRSDASNYDKCPSCRTVMTEMQIKKTCDHPRVRATHKFCRDCGQRVESKDIKPWNNPPNPQQFQQIQQQIQQQSQQQNLPASNANNTYRAGSQGAIVRCPQCQIQMRVLPHMYNMRVACPAGHQFQVALSTQNSGRGGYPGSNFRSGI